jgi:hypothetical protein
MYKEGLAVSRTAGRQLSLAAVLTGLALILVLGLAGSASAATRIVTFDDVMPDTRVSTEYETSHGVTFPDDPGARPMVKAYPGKAHSGDRVGVSTCEGLPGCGEVFPPPRLRGVLTNTATSVSAYVGYWENPLFPNPGDTMQARIRAYNSDGQLIGSSAYVTVTSGAALTQRVTTTAPAGERIAYFDVTADDGDDGGKSLAIDDVSVTTPDGPQPADFTLNAGQTVVDVLTGDSVDVAVDLNRLNGSNGNVSFSVAGLPTGMSATFNPNPVTGTGTRSVLRLSAAEGAAHSDQYTTIAIKATPSGAAAGASSRTITKQVRIRENCERTLRADFLDARSEDCMVKRAGHWEATNTTVRVNGLVIRPADDSRPTLVVDPANRTVRGRELTMPFRVSLASSPEIPIYAGPIKWDYSYTSGPADGPREIVGFDLEGIEKLKGLPVTSAKLWFLKSGKASLTPTLKLDFWPFNYFGAVTTTTTFNTSNDGGVDFSGLHLKLPKVNVLALELKDVELKWAEGTNWAGSAKVVLRFGKTYEIGAGFGIKDGDFAYLRGSVGGLNQPIGAGVFLQSIGFGVQRDPLTLAGTIGLSAGPKVAGVQAISIGGQLKAVLADPWIAEISGNAKVANRFELGSAFVRYSSTGLFEFGAQANWSMWRLGLNGSVYGWVDGLDAFNVEGSISACLDVWGPDPCGDARALLSSRGVAGCVGVYGYYVGAGATWDFDFDAFTGCDLTPYRAVRPARAAAVGALSQTTLPAGLPSAAWEVTGDGGPTGVTLTGPNGESVTVSRAMPVVQNDQFYAQLRQDGTTFVLANKPAAGRWTLTEDGTAPVKLVREARGLPKAAARVRVSGRGHKRVLSWNARDIAGQRITFAEVGKDVRNAITTTKTARGSVRFRPADGPAGRRKIIAMVQQDGRPRTNLTAGSYRAPGMLKPGKPRNLTVKRSRSRLVVSWRPKPRGFRHAVRFSLSDGRQIVRIVGAKRHTYTLKGVPRRARAKVTVMGLTRLNSKGPAARVSVKPARRRARGA